MSAFTTSKALRLLVMGRVTVRCASNSIEAVVEGDTGTWKLYREADRWPCTCPSRRPCSHLEAVERVAER